MIVLGIRIKPNITRYALVKSEDTGYELINACEESRLVYPADMDTPEKKVDWLYRELENIFQQNPDIRKVCIKVNELPGRDDHSKRKTYYLVGVTLLCCYRNNISVTMKNYQSLHTNSKEVKNYAKDSVGFTTTYWDVPMADAVVAALSECPSNSQKIS